MIYITLLVIISILGGVYLIRRSTASASAKGETRDHIRFPANDTTLTTIDAWAARSGYTLKEELENTRVYTGSTTGTKIPVFLRVERMGDEMEMQSWIVASGLGGGGELPLASGGIALSLPRKQARKPHNELRSALGLPLLS